MCYHVFQYDRTKEQSWQQKKKQLILTGSLPEFLFNSITLYNDCFHSCTMTVFILENL